MTGTVVNVLHVVPHFETTAPWGMVCYYSYFIHQENKLLKTGHLHTIVQLVREGPDFKCKPNWLKETVFRKQSNTHTIASDVKKRQEHVVIG